MSKESTRGRVLVLQGNEYDIDYLSKHLKIVTNISGNYDKFSPQELIKFTEYSVMDSFCIIVSNENPLSTLDIYTCFLAKEIGVPIYILRGLRETDEIIDHMAVNRFEFVEDLLKHLQKVPIWRQL